MNAMQIVGGHPLEWHEQRREGIGSSDAAAVLGLSRFKRPIDIYLEKVGEADPTDDTAFLEWGRRLEPVIAQAAEDELNKPLRRQGLPELRFTQWSSPVRCRDWARAFTHLDRRGRDETGAMVALECKASMSTKEWGDPCTVSVAQAHEVIPADYAIQVAHHLLCTGYRSVIIAALLGYREFRIYRIHTDRDYLADLLADEREFWGLVEARTPPEPDGSDAYGAYLARCARAVEKAPAKSPTPNQQLLGNITAAAKVELEAVKTRFEKARSDLDKAMGDAWAITAAGWKASRTAGRKTVGWESIAAAQRQLLDTIATQYPEAVRSALLDWAMPADLVTAAVELVELHSKTGDPGFRFELVTSTEEE